MELTGQWSQDLDFVIEHFEAADGRICQQLKDMPSGAVQKAASQLYTDISSVFGSMIALCRTQTHVSSLTAAALLRTLIESAMSIFAFANDTEARAVLYHNFQAILDFKNLCAQELNVGCPHVFSDAAAEQRRCERRREIEGNLRRVGGPFLRKETSSYAEREQLLADAAIAPPDEGPKRFREKWYPEDRRELLADETMARVYPIHYQRLCSAVHSDAAGSKLLGDFPRDRFIDLAMQFWASGVYRLIDVLGINVDSQTKGALRQSYQYLQWEPPKAP